MTGMLLSHRLLGSLLLSSALSFVFFATYVWKTNPGRPLQGELMLIELNNTLNLNRELNQQKELLSVLQEELQKTKSEFHQKEQELKQKEIQLLENVEAKEKLLEEREIALSACNGRPCKMETSASTKKLVVGIPTVFRKMPTKGTVPTPYVVQTLHRLLDPLKPYSPSLRQKLLIVVCNVDNHYDHWKRVDADLRLRFAAEIKSGTPTGTKHLTVGTQGLIHLVSTPAGMYTKLVTEPCKLKRKWNDSMLRVLWRSKQVLDFVFLMNYCSDKGDYYFNLEDDTGPVKSSTLWVLFATKSLSDLPVQMDEVLGRLKTNNLENRTDWAFAIYHHTKSGNKYKESDDWRTQGGAYGLLFPQWHLRNLTELMEEQFDEEPVDWLFGTFAFNKHLKVIRVQDGNIEHFGEVSTKGNLKLKPASHVPVEEFTKVIETYRGATSWSECDRQGQLAAASPSILSAAKDRLAKSNIQISDK